MTEVKPSLELGNHFDILKQGVEIWNQWRVEHSGLRPNLRAADLRLANLAGVDLTEADLSASHLEGAKLSNTKLIKADLKKAHLCGIDRSGENLTPVRLRKEDFATTNLGGRNITWTNLSKAKLCDANLTGADLSGADLREAILSRAHLDEANLTWANLEDAKLDEATLLRSDLYEAYLSRAHFEKANLMEAHLEGARIERASLSEANFTGANLCRATLIEANVENTTFNKCFVHGISTWNLQGEPKEQLNLIITRSFPPHNEPVLTVDDLEIAQFIYLILNNQKIRNVIDTITSKAVLILGRFTPERKVVLEAVREALRERGYVPMLFDFTPSNNRDLTETIQLLANMAKFVIADLTEAKSIPQELSVIVPDLPNVPVQPIMLASQKEYAMFEHWRNYHWVLPEFFYENETYLIDHLYEKVILPAENMRRGISPLEEAKRKIEELERRLAKTETLPNKA